MGDLKARFGELEARLGGVINTDASLRGIFDQFRTTFTTGFASFETVEPIVSLVSRQVHDGGLIGNGVVVAGSISFTDS